MILSKHITEEQINELFIGFELISYNKIQFYGDELIKWIKLNSIIQIIILNTKYIYSLNNITNNLGIEIGNELLNKKWIIEINNNNKKKIIKKFNVIINIILLMYIYLLIIHL